MKLRVELKTYLKNFKKVLKVLYSVGNLRNSVLVLKKASKSFYEKGKVNLYNQLDGKMFYQKRNILPVVTPFISSKSNVNHSALYSIRKPFELMHADIADTRFLAKSAVDSKYCLLLVDLCTSKVYVYPMKNRSLLLKKLRLFYQDTDKKKNR